MIIGLKEFHRVGLRHGSVAEDNRDGESCSRGNTRSGSFAVDGCFRWDFDKEGVVNSDRKMVTGGRKGREGRGV